MDLAYETNLENDIMSKPEDAVMLKCTEIPNVTEITEYLLKKKIVVLDLEGVQRDAARRVIDYSSGATAALGGQVIRATDNMFVLKPY